jgi:hypothetical protein
MELTTQFNLDDVFYAVSRAGNVTVWSINNILASAVGHKIVYEMKQATTGVITTLTEPQLQTRVDNKQMVRNTDNLRSVLEETFKKITDDSIKKAEKTKSKFLKEKLERTLNGNKRKAETSLEAMKGKIDNTNATIEEDLDEAQKVADEIYKAETEEVPFGWSLKDKLMERRKAWQEKLKSNYNTWEPSEKNKYDDPF